jgi:hypothetical protein
LLLIAFLEEEVIINLTIIRYVKDDDVKKAVKVTQSRYRPGVSQRVPGS